MYQCLPTNIIRDTKKVSVTWGNGEYFNATSYTSILIDTTLFMHELMSECINKGVKIQNEYF